MFTFGKAIRKLQNQDKKFYSIKKIGKLLTQRQPKIKIPDLGLVKNLKDD